MDTRGGNISSDYYIELGLKTRHQKPLTLKFFRGFMKRSPDFKVSKRCALEYQSAFSCDIMSGIKTLHTLTEKSSFITVVTLMGIFRIILGFVGYA